MREYIEMCGKSGLLGVNEASFTERALRLFIAITYFRRFNARYKSILFVGLLLCQLPDDRVFNESLLICDHLVAWHDEVVEQFTWNRITSLLAIFIKFFTFRIFNLACEITEIKVRFLRLAFRTPGRFSIRSDQYGVEHIFLVMLPP